METDPERLQNRSDELAALGEAESDEVVAVNRLLFDADPSNRDATNRLGIALHDRGELEDAAEVLERGLSENPVNAVAEGRLERIRRKLESLPARKPEEIVEPVLAGPGRDACIAFFAASIRQIQKIDGEYLAVIDIPSSNRFRVYGGAISACALYRGMLSVMIDSRGARNLIERIEAVGGREVSPLNLAGLVPFSQEIGVPRDLVADFHDELMEPHRRNLHEAIEAGRSGHYRHHRPDLQAYLLAEAERL